MTRRIFWLPGALFLVASLFTACDKETLEATEEIETGSGVMTPPLDPSLSGGSGESEPLVEDNNNEGLIGDTPYEVEEEATENTEGTTTPEEEVANTSVNFNIQYNGTVEGDLLVTLFEVWPPVAPPAIFSMVPNVTFPSDVTLDDVAAGTWTAVAVLDADPKNPASQGPEDRMGLVEIQVPATGVVTIVISDDAPEMPEEEEEVVVEETPEPVVTNSTLRFDRLTVDADANGPAFGNILDIDGDGQLEIVVASFGTVTGLTLPNGEVSIYEQGNSLSEWTKTKLFTEAEGIVWPNDVGFEDVDGDGDLDALVPYGFLICGAIPLTGPCGGLAWFEQTASGWDRHDVIPYGDTLFYHKALLTDLDGDGLKDLITVGEEKTASFTGSVEQAQVKWFAGTNTADRFETTATVIGEGLGSLPELYDVDGDGDMDIVSAEFFAKLGAAYAWYEQVTAPTGAGTGSWTRHVINATEGPSIQLALVEDFYGDGDVIALGANHTNNNADPADPEPSSFVSFRMPADPTTPWDMTTITTVFSSVPGSSMSPQAAPGIFGVGDADNDGDMDVLLSGDGDPRTFLLEQLAAEEFVIHVLDENMGQAGGMVIKDIDGDGNSELLTSSYDESGVYLYVQAENGAHPIGVAEAPQSWWDEFGPVEEPEVETEEPGDTTGTTEDPTAMGPYSVTTSSTTVAGAAIPVDIYLPTGVTNPSVVALHHGFLLNIAFYSTVATHMASHGFAVFVPQTHEPGELPFGKPTVAEEMDTVLAFYSWLETADVKNTYGPFSEEPIGVVGHSRGGKIAWLVGQEIPEKVRGVVAVDPVDSAGSVTAGDVMALDNPLPSQVASLSLGMGLAGVSTGLFSPACAPEDSNYSYFYSGAQGEAWSVELLDAGHLDILDDNPAGCVLVCSQCTTGSNPAMVRATICGLTVSFLKGFVSDEIENLDYLSQSAEHPVETVVSSK